MVLPATAVPFGTLSLVQGTLYALFAEAAGNASSGNGSAVQLTWGTVPEPNAESGTDLAADNVTLSRAGLVPSGRLYRSRPVQNSPFYVTVSNGPFCAAKSGVFGAAVSLATAGCRSVFTLQ
eukprot:2111125-Rhodomonas_salina.9